VPGRSSRRRACSSDRAWARVRVRLGVRARVRLGVRARVRLGVRARVRLGVRGLGLGLGLAAAGLLIRPPQAEEVGEGFTAARARAA